MRSMSGATAVWIAGAALAAAGEAPTESLRDVAYVDAPHAEQHLDFDWPGGKPPATVLFVHGGSLRESGERRSSPPYRDVCRPFLDAGYACATTDYRLAPSSVWPAMAHDVASAVARVRALGAERGGDAERLFLFGRRNHDARTFATHPVHFRGRRLARVARRRPILDSSLDGPSGRARASPGRERTAWCDACRSWLSCS